MKASLLKRHSQLLLILALVGLVGCGSAQDSDIRTSEGTVGLMGASCQDGTSATGEVYNTAGDANQMTEAARGLVSATLDPKYLGQVPARGGIELRLQLPKTLMENGTISSGKIYLQIKDSQAGTLDGNKKLIPPYPVSVSSVAGGGRTMSGQYQVVFADQYGSITVSFHVNGAHLVGTISYQNQVHASGEPVRQGVLGAFTVPSCGVFY